MAPEPAKLPEALREALAQVARDDASELLAEARLAARARARAVLEDVLVEELLRAVSTGPESSQQSTPGKRPASRRRAAAPTEAETTPEVETATEKGAEPSRGAAPDANAWWAYCVIGAADREAAPVGLPGVEGPVTLVEEGELVALVSPVPLSEFSDERLREHLNDVAWVERVARAHEAVLDRMLERATILPLRLCTLYKDRDGVTRMLREQAPVLRQALSSLDGRREWGVKLFVDAQGLAGVGPDPEGAPSSGAAYLARRQRERQASKRAHELADTVAQEVHGRLEQVADAARANPLQRPEVHGRDARMLLNGAYLVAREREGELEEAIGSLREQWQANGFQLELTGPWPPYNFVTSSAMVMP